MFRWLTQVLFFAMCTSTTLTLLSAQVVTGTTLYTFSGGSDGGLPNSLMQGSDGNYYGTTTFGGNNLQSGACLQGTGCGTIFRMSPSGNFTSLYVFTGGVDGSYPNPLIQGDDGKLYGTAIFGGAGSCTDSDSKVLIGCGTIFRLSLDGTFTTLYSFYGGIDGAYPNQLVEGSDGNFFGTTVSSVFEMSPTGELVALYDFTGQADGWFPLGLTEGSDGNFYGITEAGGNTFCDEGCGTVFAITPTGIFTTLYTFTGEGDSGNIRPHDTGNEKRGVAKPSIVIRQPKHLINQCPPVCSRGDLSVYSNLLVENSTGSFWGTTSGQLYVPTVNGTFFDITTSGGLTTLYMFPDTLGLGNSLVLGSDGNVYGDDLSESSFFQKTSSGVFNNLYDFAGIPNALIQGSDGNFYAASSGPEAGAVMKLSLTPSLPPPVALSFSSSTAYSGSSLLLNWSASNAFSNTLKQCYASIQGSSGGGGYWSGPQTGIVGQSGYYGSATITPTEAGIYTYALTCGGVESGFSTLTVNPADFSLSANPTKASVGEGQSASFAISVLPLGAFNTQISFSCTGLPTGATCNFNPSALTPGAATSTTAMTISTSQALSYSPNCLAPRLNLMSSILLLLMAAIVSGTSFKSSKRLARRTFMCALFAALLMASCGGNGTSTGSGSVPPAYTVTVTGLSGAVQHNVTLSLTVQ